jgi:hypothetical protein
MERGGRDATVLALGSAFLAASILAVGLAANEDSIQRRIHEALPWTRSPDLCDPWSVAWLLAGIGIATAALFFMGLAARRGAHLRPQIIRWFAWVLVIGAEGYWIANLVVSLAGSCIP